MNSVNKVLLSFLLLISIFFIGAWNFVQSERVGSFISKEVTKFTKKKINVSINFNRLKLKFFPLGTLFENVSISAPDNNLALSAREVKVSFGLFDLLSNKLSIENLTVDTGVILRGEVLRKTKQREQQDIKFEEVFDEIQKMTLKNEKIRIQSFSLRNINLQDEKFGIAKFTRFDASAFKNVIILDGVADASGVLNSLVGERARHFDHDEVSLQVELTRKKVRIKKLELKDELNRMSLKGVVSRGSSGELVTVSNFVYEGGMSKVGDYLKENIDGFVKLSASLSGPIENLKVDSTLNLQDFVSPWAIIDEASVGVSLDEGNIKVTSLEAKRKKGTVTLINETSLYDLNNNKFLFNSADLDLRDMHTNDALFFLNDILKILKGEITGKVKFSYQNKNLIFDIFEGSKLSKFILGKNTNNYILKNPNIDLYKSRVLVELTGATYLDMDLAFEGSRIHSKGWIRDGRIDLFSDVGQVDLEGLGPVAGEEMKGKGSIKFDVIGPFNDVKLVFSTSLRGFEVLKFRIGDADADFNISINESKLYLDRVDARKDNSEYTANGSINFSNSDLDLKFSLPQIAYASLYDVLDPLVKSYWAPDPLNNDFTVKGDFRVFGKAQLKRLQLEGTLSSKALFLYNETVDSLSTAFTFKGGELAFSNILMQKNNGILKGYVSFNGFSNFLDYKIYVSDLSLSSFGFYQLLGLGFESKLNAELNGKGFTNNFKSSSIFNLVGSRVEHVPVGNSFLQVNSKGKLVNLKGALFADQISINSTLNLDKKSSEASTLKMRVDMDDVKTILGAIEKKNMEDRSLKGSITGSVISSFDFYKPEKLSVNLILDYLNIQRTGTNIRTIGKGNKIIIEKGSIKDWNIILRGDNDYIISKGKGDIHTEFRVDSEYRFAASVLEVLSSKYEIPEGDMFGRYLLLGNRLRFNSFLETSGEGIKIKLEKIPGIFSNIKFHSIAEGASLQISNIQAEYGNGLIKGGGLIKFGLNYPEVDLYYKVDKTFIKVFKKSGFLLSGNGQVQGDRLPYLASGQINLLHGKIYDEIEELAKTSNDRNVVYKYVPEKKSERRFNILNYDFNLSMLGPVHIQNQLSDIKMIGSLKVGGTTTSPDINGRLSAMSGSDSKFKFKGHEFLLSEGIVDFGELAGRRQISLKFVGTADVKNYDIKLDLEGPSDKLAMSLSSNPPLAKEDLFSLLTLGVTSDVTKNLGEEQRQSVTTIGIGTLIFDQLKLNEGLSSSMGLKLSILPEVAQDDTTFLEGKQAVSSTSTRLRSTTKIRLEKKITKDVDISLTTTLGGTIDQRQEMNINYNINDNISLDGVFEVQEENVDTNESANSVGADIKYKWSF